jgi:hypothetical protein
VRDQPSPELVRPAFQVTDQPRLRPANVAFLRPAERRLHQSAGEGRGTRLFQTASGRLERPAFHSRGVRLPRNQRVEN